MKKVIMIIRYLVYLIQASGVQKFWIMDPVFRGVTQDI